MLKNEVIGSSTVLKEINHDIYGVNGGSALGLAKSHHATDMTGSDYAVASMTVASTNHPGGVATSAEHSGEENTSGNSAKRYQSIIDAARQLDSITSKISTVEGLFGKEVLEQRRKLKDLCEKLLFDDPKKYGVVARDRMWRSAFYDVMSKAKRLKKASAFRPVQQVLIKNHLLSGIGQLNIIIMKLCDFPEFRRAKLRFMPNWSSNVLAINSELSSNQLEEDQSIAEVEGKWLLDILYMCLINCGDLFRYLTEVFCKDVDAYSEYFDHAQHYYSKAFLLNPTSGLAHNQLGNLSLKFNDGLDSTYYLLYSMCTADAYPGAYSNLKQLLDGQLVHFATMPAVAELKPIDSFAHTFLGLIYHLICTEGTHLSHFEKSCKEALIEFHALLNSTEGEHEKQVYFRVAIISIMAVWRLHAVDSNYVSTAVAFASGLLLNLTNYLSIMVKDKSVLVPISAIQKPKDGYDFKNEIGPEQIGEDLCKSRENDTDHSLGEDSNAGSKERIKLARRRKRRGPRSRRIVAEDPSSSEEEENDIYSDKDSDTESHESDLILSDSASSYENDSSSEGELDSDPEGEELIGTVLPGGDEKIRDEESVSSGNDYHSEGSKTNEASDYDNKEGTARKEEVQLVLTVNDLLASIRDVEPIMIAMTPYVRWFKSSPLIVSAFVSNCGDDFMQNMCDIMNILGTLNWTPTTSSAMEEKPKAEVLCGWYSLVQGIGNDQNHTEYELSEDRSMLGLPNFADDLKNLQRSENLSFSDVVLIRVGRVLAFGHWLASLDGVVLKYSKEKGTFALETAKNGKFYNQARRLKHLRDDHAGQTGYDDESKPSWKRNRRSRRKRDFDVRLPQRLRRNQNRSDDPNKHITADDTIYVLCDLPALLHHFDIIRRLAMYSKFTVVLPYSVHGAIDNLKDKEEEKSKDARVVASWIEEQSDRAGIRVLRRGDKLRLDFEYPEPPSEAAREFIDVLESCNHFRVHENKVGRPATKFFDDVRDKYRVLYLSGHLDLLKPKHRTEFNAREIAQTAHIFVDRVTFYVENQGRQIRKRRNRNKGKG